MQQFVLSTSTLSTDTIVFGGFGPVVKEGLGIGYDVDDKNLGAIVSTYKVYLFFLIKILRVNEMQSNIVSH